MRFLSREELELLSKEELIEIILGFQGQIQELVERIGRLEKTSTNSSRPPSTDGFRAKPKRNQSLRGKSGRKPGGQVGHVGKTREQVESPDEIELCYPKQKCEACNIELNMADVKVIEKRQEIEIPTIKPRVIEYQKVSILCECGHCNVGQFPEHIQASVQIGQKMRSFLIYLNVKQVIPYKRLTELCTDLFGFNLCKRSIENALEEAAIKGQSVYGKIMESIKASLWVGSDETGMRVKGSRWWQWVWQNNEASYYAIDQGRGYAVVKEHFGEEYEGTAVHDCWSAQNNTVAKTGHQQCHPHLQREFQFLIETYKSEWAYTFNAFLKSSQKARDIIWENDFDVGLRERIISDYQKRLTRFLVKDALHKDVLRIQKRICKHHNAILHFMGSPDIPFHNNGSERAIRMSKVKQNISGCFRSVRGAERHAILLSIIETAKKQNLNVLAAIQLLLRNSLVFYGAR